MENAKDELRYDLKGKAKIKCAKIWESDYCGSSPSVKWMLPVNFTKKQLTQFYKSLDFEYDSGYGSQHLLGTVWLSDGTWLSRGEYDGSEWWEHNELPEIPLDLYY